MLAVKMASSVLSSTKNINNRVFIFEVLDLELFDYNRCVSLQRSLSEDIFLGNRPSVLILAEHNPVITLGRQARKENILKTEDEIKSLGIEIVNINRGGDVTLHLPGQLVIYPIFDLRLLGRDINLFLRNMEKAAILLLKDYGICAENRPSPCTYLSGAKGRNIRSFTGVWAGNKKIASIGIAISHWVSTHGLSLNVNCDLDLFSLIRPCGEDIMMTSMEKLLAAQNLKIDKIKKQLADKFRRVYCFGG